MIIGIYIQNNMELGKIQKQWIADLRKYPERQIKNKLGEKNEKGVITACCLGQALLTYCELEGIKPVWEFSIPHNNSFLSDFLHSEMSLVSSHNKLGLITSNGNLLKSTIINDQKFITLSQMNDYGLTWLEIADYIESNPENVFKESR